MGGKENRTALNGLEKKLFKLMSTGATKAQWAQWLRAPLEHALAHGDKKLARTLMKAGADGRAGWKGCGGRTLLGAAAEGGSHEMVSAVLETGGLEELDKVSGEGGKTALHLAIAGGHTDAARVLMLAGADVGLLDGRDRSPLHYAVEGGHLRFAEYVVVGGGDLSQKDTDGNTPLHLATASDDRAFVTTLLRRGASVSAANKEGQHPLHMAVEYGHVDVAEALLKAGADPNVYYEADRSPLYLARHNLAMTKSLLKHGADVHLSCKRGFTALHYAVADGQADIVEALVEAGAKVDARCGLARLALWGHFTGLTPLHVGSLLCNLGGMAALLREGAGVNALDAHSQTPLHVLCKTTTCTAARVRTGEVASAVDLLLRWGADETLADDDGRTAEQLVERIGINAVVRQVLANAPADRAWRRRGTLVMCRALPDKIKTLSKGGKGRVGRPRVRRGRERTRGGAGGARRRDDVIARVVDLEDDAIFRTILGYL